MSNPTQEEVQEAYRKFARKHGHPAAKTIVDKNGGTDGDYQTVPEDRWAQLIAAFGRAVHTRSKNQMTPAQTAQGLAALNQKAFAKFNAKKAGPTGGFGD